MLINWKTRIEGTKVILVPYCEHHVEKYHRWMKSEELQRLTGSEPLSLEEEHKMQESWRDSDDKCTFIVLSREAFQDGNEENAMIGDTNLFIQNTDSTGCDNGPLAEVEIMIAEPNARGQKMGIEAVSLMIRYGIETLKIPTFQAKIKDDNTPSIKMFQKLGFELVSDKSNVFGELELKSPRDTDNFLAQLKSNFGKYELQDYVR